MSKVLVHLHHFGKGEQQLFIRWQFVTLALLNEVKSKADFAEEDLVLFLRLVCYNSYVCLSIQPQ